MRELDKHECEQVVGGDGMKLPGGGYISGTRKILGLQGVAGAVSTAFTVGYGIGTALNAGIESQFGMNAGDVVYGWKQNS